MSGLDAGFLNSPIAHRGLHGTGIPENSLAAFDAAVARGFGIELDVQASRDGVPMVFHDYRLERLTGETGLVQDRSAAELSAMPLLGGDDRVPTLEAVLEQVGGAVPLLIEIKDQDGALGRVTGGLSAAVDAVLAGYEGPVAVMSFNPHHLVGLDCTRGLVTCDFSTRDWTGVPSDRLAGLAAILEADAVGASFISHDRRDLERQRVADLRAQGLSVLCWTVRSAKEEAKAREVAQNITFEGYDPG